MLVGAVWTDITSFVMVRDGGAISISRGQTSNGDTPDPGSCSFQLNNRDGRFSPSNPMGPYYGQFGRNSQLRVSVLKADGITRSFRFWGSIPEFPEGWDLTEKDIWVDITAAGILRQLRQGSAPLGSTLYRGLTGDTVVGLKAYWPMEDGAQSTSIASAIGGPSMVITGSPNLASDTVFLCSNPLPVTNGSTIRGVVPTYTSTGQTQIRFLLDLPTPLANNTQIIKAHGTGSVPFWAVTYNTGGGLSLRGLDTDGITVLFDTGPVSFNIDNSPRRVSMGLTQSGANVNWILATVDVSNGVNSQLTGTFTAATVGLITSIQTTPGQTATDTVIGHISLQAAVTAFNDLGNAVTAFLGESAGLRLNRLCDERGVDFEFFNPLSADRMGPQLPNAFLDLIQECVDVDGGILLERELAFGLAFRSRLAMLDADPGLILSYTHGDMADIPAPVPDDLNLRNDIIAQRPSGSSARSTLSTGPLSVLDPPNGVGLYQDNPTLNVELDADLQYHADWRLHIGTTPDARYPVLTVNLARTEITTSQRNNVLGVLPGIRVKVTGAPIRLGQVIDQLVIGIQETINLFTHIVNFTGIPYSPNLVAKAGDLTVLGSKADTAGSTLNASATSAATTFSVATSTGPTWTTDVSQYPFDLTVSGEQVTALSTGTVLNANPLLLTDAGGWLALGGSSFTRDTAVVNTGSGAVASLKLIPDGVTAVGGVFDAMTAVGSITVGNTYRASGWFHSVLGFADLEMAIDWYNSSSVFLSTSVGPSQTVAANTWTFIGQSFVAPASASRAVVRGRFGTAPTTANILRWWDILLFDAATSTGTSPQTISVIRSVNGVVKAQTSGATISLTAPAVAAL